MKRINYLQKQEVRKTVDLKDKCGCDDYDYPEYGVGIFDIRPPKEYVPTSMVEYAMNEFINDAMRNLSLSLYDVTYGKK